MADKGDLDVDETPGYKAPAKVDLDTLKNLDADDDALNRWKAKLLEGAAVADNGDPRNVIVEGMTFAPTEHAAMTLDLTGDLSALKGKEGGITVKEGSEYRIVINFRVQREVVAGLKYVHAVYRKGVRVGKDAFMLGSYGPKGEAQSARTQMQDAPKGMLARGTYTVKSKFIDDDKEVHLAWEWSLHIKKDWKN